MQKADSKSVMRKMVEMFATGDLSAVEAVIDVHRGAS
jgi:hypothetical protein